MKRRWAWHSRVSSALGSFSLVYLLLSLSSGSLFFSPASLLFLPGSFLRLTLTDLLQLLLPSPFLVLQLMHTHIRWVQHRVWISSSAFGISHRNELFLLATRCILICFTVSDVRSYIQISTLFGSLFSNRKWNQHVGVANNHFPLSTNQSLTDLDAESVL